MIETLPWIAVLVALSLLAAFALLVFWLVRRPARVFVPLAHLALPLLKVHFRDAQQANAVADL